jgi:UDP-2,3-diacylglucosamine hydrolase
MNKIGNEKPHSLFISDLHLCASRPAVTRAFLDFLEATARRAEKLFILGDLFEYWAGDDDLDSPEHQAIIQAFKALSTQGVEICLIHGNRDFLMGEAFSQRAGVKILHDPSALVLYGWRILLSHGDALCTDDLEYQQFKKMVRSQDWQANFLGQPLQTRKAQIEALRRQSEQEKSNKSSAIMDVNQGAVEALLTDFDYPALLIHGHTHRPQVHQLSINGHDCARIVLGDWYDQGSCLSLDETGFRNIAIQI